MVAILPESMGDAGSLLLINVSYERKKQNLISLKA